MSFACYRYFRFSEYYYITMSEFGPSFYGEVNVVRSRAVDDEEDEDDADAVLFRFLFIPVPILLSYRDWVPRASHGTMTLQWWWRRGGSHGSMTLQWRSAVDAWGGRAPLKSHATMAKPGLEIW